VSYQSEILADSPVSYWRLGESTGISAADLGSGANPGTYTPNSGGAWTGGTLNQAGLVPSDPTAGAPLFNGAGGYVACPGVAADVGDNPSRLTIHAALYRDATNKAVHLGWLNDTTHLACLQWFTDGNLYAQFGNGSNTFGLCAVAGTGIRYVTAVFDGTQTGNAARLKVYVNGVAQTLTFTGTIPATLGTAAQLGQFDIGRNAASATYSSGKAQDVAVFAAALSAARDAAYYTAATRSIAATPAAIPAGHAGNVTLSLVGSGTAWDGSTVFAVSGVTGAAKVSQTVTDATHATLVVTTAAGTGTLSITDGQSAPASVAVANPTLSLSPSSGASGGSGSVTATGVNTVWTQETAASLFTLSGGTGASISSINVTTDTAATFTLNRGSATATLTVDDASSSAAGSSAAFQVDPWDPTAAPVADATTTFGPMDWSADALLTAGSGDPTAGGGWLHGSNLAATSYADLTAVADPFGGTRAVRIPSGVLQAAIALPTTGVVGRDQLAINFWTRLSITSGTPTVNLVTVGSVFGGGFQVYLSGPTLVLDWYNPGPTPARTTLGSLTLTANVYRAITVTYDGAQVRVYADGVLQGSAVTVTAMTYWADRGTESYGILLGNANATYTQDYYGLTCFRYARTPGVAPNLAGPSLTVTPASPTGTVAQTLRGGVALYDETTSNALAAQCVGGGGVIRVDKFASACPLKAGGTDATRPFLGRSGLYSFDPQPLARTIDYVTARGAVPYISLDSTPQILGGTVAPLSGAAVTTTYPPSTAFSAVPPRKTITGLSYSGTTATLTVAAHGYTTGDTVYVDGLTSTPADSLNGTKTITVDDADHVHYTVAAGLTGTAVGTGKITGPADLTALATVFVDQLDYVVTTMGVAVPRVGVGNEPEILGFWPQTPTVADVRALYARMYVTVHQAVKAAFPSIKVAALTSASDFTQDQSWLLALFQACQAAGVAPDYIDYHDYTGSLSYASNVQQAVTAQIAAAGYTGAVPGILCSEWSWDFYNLHNSAYPWADYYYTQNDWMAAYVAQKLIIAQRLGQPLHTLWQLPNVDLEDKVYGTGLYSIEMINVSSLTSSGTTATCRVLGVGGTSGYGHGLHVGDAVTISGATPSAYNGTWTVSGVSNAVSFPGAYQDFTFTFGGAGNVAASGTLTVLGPNNRKMLAPGNVARQWRLLGATEVTCSAQQPWPGCEVLAAKDGSGNVQVLLTHQRYRRDKSVALPVTVTGMAGASYTLYRIDSTHSNVRDAGTANETLESGTTTGTLDGTGTATITLPARSAYLMAVSATVAAGGAAPLISAFGFGFGY
jgi:hypothetical protein